MTVDEIFSDMAAHMIKGLMVHDQMVNYYYFLSLDGYAKCHEYHYLCENKSYTKLTKHYFKYHNKLIKSKNVSNPDLIPQSWYSYERKDVDVSTKRNAVKTGLEKWLDWEKDTLTLYKKMYEELVNLGEITDAKMVECLICDVSEEIAEIHKYYIKKQTLDFAITDIIADQHKDKEKYKNKIHEHCCCC